MITMGIIKKWATDTLKDSTEYQQFCIDTIGTVLNFYRSAPMDRPAEELPFFTAFSDQYEEDDMSQQFWNESWILPVMISIKGEDDSENDSDVTVWTSTDKVELLALKAKEILKKEANGCGVNGEAISVLKTNLAISEIGEADDVQASLFITFGKSNSI